MSYDYTYVYVVYNILLQKFCHSWNTFIHFEIYTVTVTGSVHISVPDQSINVTV